MIDFIWIFLKKYIDLYMNVWLICIVNHLRNRWADFILSMNSFTFELWTRGWFAQHKVTRCYHKKPPNVQAHACICFPWISLRGCSSSPRVRMCVCLFERIHLWVNERTVDCAECAFLALVHSIALLVCRQWLCHTNTHIQGHTQKNAHTHSFIPHHCTAFLYCIEWQL